MFLWPDYAVFGATIMVSLAIGVFYALQARRRLQTTEDFFIPQMRVVPVSLSMSVSFLSSIAILGNSAELHYYGATYMFYLVGTSLGIIWAAFGAVPIFHPLKLTSINQVGQPIDYRITHSPRLNVPLFSVQFTDIASKFAELDKLQDQLDKLPACWLPSVV